jgi:two-component sensor histidine kinase
VIHANEIVGPKRPSLEADLLLREWSHRVNNEFASIIGAVSMASARTKNDETKAALNLVEDKLLNYAQVYDALRMPESSTQIDAAAYLRQLCRAISRAKLQDRGIELILVDHPVKMTSERCWRLGLIVSELITNAARRAFHDSGGVIRVEVLQPTFLIQCCVTDNGSGDGVGRPGCSSRIVRALAESLGGTIEQRFGVHGGIATVIVPLDHL